MYSEVWNLMFKKYKSNFKSVFYMIYRYEVLLIKSLYIIIGGCFVNDAQKCSQLPI